MCGCVIIYVEVKCITTIAPEDGSEDVEVCFCKVLSVYLKRYYIEGRLCIINTRAITKK